jgi:hypothetical protein
MNKLPKNPLPFGLSGCYLAGGAILSIVTKNEVSDYDIYPKSKEAMLEAFHQIYDNNCFLVSVSDRAVTFKCNDVLNDAGERAIIQVMTFDEFETPEKIFEYFDFSVCMCAFDTDTEQYHFGPEFWQSVASRTLYFNPKTRYPLNSAIRVGKYTSKGYFLPKAESIKISLAVINSGMPKSWDELEATIGGTYGRQLRLDVGDTEFSYENALTFLSDMVLDVSNYETDQDYSDIKAEELEFIFSSSAIKYVDVVTEGDFISSGYSIRAVLDGYGNLKPLSKTEEEILKVLGVVFEELDPETRIGGYKFLIKKDDGSYENSIFRPKKMLYAIGEEATEPNSPHIFIYPLNTMNRLGNNKNGTKCSFSFLIKDLKKVTSSEYSVITTRFERVVDS